MFRGVLRLTVLAVIATLLLSGWLPLTAKAQNTGVNRYCKNNSNDIKSVSLTIKRDANDPDVVVASYTVSHIPLTSDENIGVWLYSTTLKDGQEKDFVEQNFVSHLDKDSSQRKKDSSISSSGTFNLFEATTGLVYRFVLLAFSPSDAGNSSTVVFGDEVAKNRCSSVINFNTTYDTTKPPTPTDLSLGYGVPANPEIGDIDLSWKWQWTRSKNADFKLVFTEPSGESEKSLSGDTATAGFFRANIAKYVATGTTTKTFGVVAIVNKIRSNLSGQITIHYGADGKMTDYVLPDGSATTRDELAKMDPTNSGSSDSEEECSINWIATGGSGLSGLGFKLLGLGDSSPPKLVDALGLKESELKSPFTRLALCVYVWVVDPVIQWATGLIEDVGGIAWHWQPPREYAVKEYA